MIILVQIPEVTHSPTGRENIHTNTQMGGMYKSTHGGEVMMQSGKPEVKTPEVKTPGSDLTQQHNRANSILF